MKNAEVSHMLREIADLLEMKEVAFKPRAYRRAARGVEALSDPIEKLHERGELEEIQGVGEGIAEKIATYLEQGRLEYLEKLKEEMPADVEALTAVEGLGPKRVEALYKALGIKTLDDLERAAKEGKIATVETFGETMQQRILERVARARRGQERTLLGRAIPVVNDLLEQLEASEAFDRIEAVGSLRRWMPTIGDVDFLATTHDRAAAMDAFTQIQDVEIVLTKGATKASLQLTSGIQVDLRVIDDDAWGSALLYFTGSKDHNIQLRTMAQEQGWKLNEYGLFDGDERLASSSEKDVYDALGLAYIEPELREMYGEVAAARDGELPELVSVEAIQGDLQMHTTWSDGSASILEMAQAADERGYAYIAITDHGPSLRIAGGPDAQGMHALKQEIDKVQEEVDVEVLWGAEANIDRQGELDIPREQCAELDLVVAALHARAEDATERIVHAIEHYPVDILAHPTNQRIGQRRPNDLDLDRVCQAAADNHVALEINAQIDRLDLDWRHVLEHRDEVMWVVSTDAHTPGELHNMDLGVSQARKAWLTPDHVLNTRSWDEVRGMLGG